MPTERPVTFDAYPVQNALMDLVTDGRYNYIGFGGGIRASKTWGTLACLIVLCRLFPGSRWGVIRKDLERLRKSTLPSFNKLRRLTGGFIGPVHGTTWEATCRNGSVIGFRGEHLDRDPDLDWLDGYEANGFDLEEADELHEKTFHKCIERAGAWIIPDAAQQPYPLVLATFNPNASWPKRVFFDPWEQGTIAPPYAFVPATIADNLSYEGSDYAESLKNLPPEEYEIRVGGDWSKLSGRFYRSITRSTHLIPRSSLPAELPDWWEYWGSYDWGYDHWAVFGAWAKDTDGAIYLLDSLWMRREQDEDQAKTILAATMPQADGRPLFPKACLNEVYAGHDCWASMTARGGSGVTTAEVFDNYDILLTKADIDLVNGGRAVRRVTAVRPVTAKDGSPLLDPAGDPVMRTGAYLIDTEGNRRVLDQLMAVMPDEHNVNKPGKQNADAYGRGGDDGSDMYRYGIATRIQEAEIPYPTPEMARERAKLDTASRREAESFDKLVAKAMKGKRYAG